MSFSKLKQRLRRKRRIRKNIFGTPEKPRLSVYRSLRHVYAQLIDDLNTKTLAEANSLKLGFKSGNRKAAELVGAAIAQKAKQMKVEKAAFDRNGFLYHGAVKALSDGARKEGLKF
ncbi:MAG: 50S ribosomal protein L18 [Deltaproteobacteria bacterium]|nr:50S ribosomal protein L18 [Deltaproteobacteria bacterium]